MAGLNDPMKFIPAEEFFNKLPTAKETHSLVSAQSSQSLDPKDPLRFAAFLTFDDATTCLFQYVTPQLWRIRYDPSAKQPSDYPDANTRTIVQNSFAALVDELQIQLRREDPAWNAPKVQPDSYWATTFTELSDQSGWILASVRYPSQNDAKANTNGVVITKALFGKNPFQIQCSRTLKPQADFSVTTPEGTTTEGAASEATASEGIIPEEKIIWSTDPRGSFLRNPEYPRASNLAFAVAKPTSARYVGFGEQGGQAVLKNSTLMNYFCYDNLGYSKVYNQGPLDNREPLYHSQPFFMQLNGTPGYKNTTATLVDNYSQVFIDLGKFDNSRIHLGVRFGILDVYTLAADDVPQLIWLFTSIVGRPKLKPRFILGHHQGGYGYMNRGDLENVVSGYRNAGIPLDGLHIDVDLQHKYRTFTYDSGRFNDIAAMFAGLRQRGVKCCTNITPIISLDGYKTDDDPYPAINAAWNRDKHTDPAKNFLIMDNRFLDGISGEARDQRYLHYQGGSPNITDPNIVENRPDFSNGKDRYNFAENFKSGYPFHGGVSYGDGLGITGFYPDLNRQAVREKFWGPQYTDLFEKGLEFVWQDMTTPAVADCYGDMLGFPGRLLMSTDPYEQQDNVLPPQKPAIELWALYSYNLHKATYKALDSLPSRQNKRNFIIGRGSSTGMHRFAGLWSGDNVSSWDFWKITVSQVIALGLGGISIAGVDMGGFMPDDGYFHHPPDNSKSQWCDPDLFIRWYSGAFLLPWYRNHYNGKGGQKLFQEVYKFATIQQDWHITVPQDQNDLYASVLPICKYYVRLRYSLMQALYDRMFENLINGLPITRSMLITDPTDVTLFGAAAPFLDNQYLLGHNILVCPITAPDNDIGGSREVYLPRPDSWFASNLRIDGDAGGLGVPLSPAIAGGTTFSYNARITSNPAQLPYMVPIYIRAGAIIPQIEVRDSIGDGRANPITLHVYPGKNDWYSMFLDDGVSRSSAPMDLPQFKNISSPDPGDAKGEYREVRIKQETTSTGRTITLSHIHNNFNAVTTIGPTYTVVLWNAPPFPAQSPTVTFKDQQGNTLQGCSSQYHSDVGAVVATIPTELASGNPLVIGQALAG